MNKKLSAVLIILILATLACSTSMAPSTSPAENIIFADDFSTQTNGWPTEGDGGNQYQYYEGGYRLYVGETGTDWVGGPENEFPADVIIEVEATKLGGDDNNNFGVFCRARDLGNMVVLQISSDGFASIAYYQGGSLNYLVDWTSENAINEGSSTNAIRAECIGTTFKIYANNRLVASATDSTFTSGGYIGLLAGTFDVAGTDILFDDFVVYRP
ncbi:MAG: hypothetical protein ABIJ39_09670 [Chloroflexota bacterium]